MSVEPRVLKWLRESSGWTVEEAGKKLKTNPKAVTAMESGETAPTLGQLKILSSSFKRPLASFFLPEPKKERPLPRDYRFLPGKKEGMFDKKTILAIRRSRVLQGIGAELSTNIGNETRPNLTNVDMTHDPDDIASRYRKLFGLTWEKQTGFRDAYKLFNHLRGVLEGMRILVFKFSMPVEDARGFALVDEAPAVIVVNSRDSIEARLFTLMHEFGHVLLGETVIDIPEASSAINDGAERWCNAFASSFLLPAQESRDLFNEDPRRLTETETLDALSKKCKVSKAALLLKMSHLGHISKSQHESVLARYRPAVKETKGAKSERKKISMSSDQRCLSEVGNRFVSLVADNFDRKLITYTDAIDYLSIKSGSFDKILSKAKT